MQVSTASERLAVDVADAQALKARAASGDPEALRSAARQFESLLVAQMLKTMRETSFSEEDDPMTGGDGVKLYRELLDQQWASKISNGQGLGFAEMMVKAMESRASGVVSASALTNPASSLSEGSGVVSAAALANPATAPGRNELARDASVAIASKLAPTEIPTVEIASKLAPTGVASVVSGDVSALSRKQAFLETMKPHAEAASAATGVPARFILAHAALESGWGQREIRGDKGEASHNLFGIKAGASWSGASVQTLTTEYRQGVPMKMTQSFRAYDDYGAGFTDYANLLKARYGAALSEGTNDAAFAKGLAAGGYATDPAYAGKLKSVIASVALAGG
jgi:flagellar protein FlgJ